MRSLISFLIFLCFFGAAVAADKALDTPLERYSYTIGLRLGDLLERRGLQEIDADALARGVSDKVDGRTPLLDDAAQLQAEKDQRAAGAAANLAAGRTFLKENRSKPGVVELAKGLQVIELQAGAGPSPSPADKVRVHYHGTKIDGTVFDSSVDRGEPAEFALGGVVPGFREALTQMKVGSKWRVFMPSELAYGERGAGGAIGANEVLIFEIELLKIL